MRIEIDYIPQDDQYYAKIYDGPDGIDESSYFCSSLGEVFEKIVVFRTLLSLEYK